MDTPMRMQTQLLATEALGLLWSCRPALSWAERPLQAPAGHHSTLTPHSGMVCFMQDA